MEFLLLFLVFGGIIAVVAYLSHLAAERRKQELAQLAQSAGLQFLPGQVPDVLPGGFFANLFGDRSQTEEGRLLSRFSGYWPFDVGDSPEVKNLLYGSREAIDWTIFDYSYETHSTDSKGNRTTHTHSFGVVAARFGIAMPALCLEPENLLHRIGSKLGMSEVTVEVEEFNRKYFIRAADKKAAYDVLHPQCIDYLMRLPPRRWEVAGPQLVIAKSGSYDPPEIMRVMEEIRGFLELLPGYVKQDRGFQPQWTDHSTNGRSYIHRFCRWLGAGGRNVDHLRV